MVVENKTFFCCFVLYHPDRTVIEKINNLQENKVFDKIIVYDNTETADEDLSLSPDISYKSENANLGLSIVYNRAIETSMHENADYLCIMDQDSDYKIPDINVMIDYLNACEDNFDNVAIIAPRSYCATSKKHIKESDITDIDFVINSGSFLNLKCLKKFGLRYDENIFLDGVDEDFCLAAKKKNCNILIYENSFLYQNLGDALMRFGKPFCSHAPIRYYYMGVARKYINRKYYGFFKGGMLTLFKNVKTFLIILVYERNRICKMKQLLKSCFAGIQNK